MNNSLEYMKKRIQEGNCKNMPPEEFEHMYYINTLECGFGVYNDCTVLAKRNGCILADMTYSPNAEFNYFITESCVCDGTLVFLRELMQNILNKITRLGTCYATVMKDISQEELDNGDYTIHYEVGDFVVNSYIIDPPDEDKPWVCDRFTVMLPVKFTVGRVKL